MTLKDLRAVNERFVEPEELDKSIGSHEYKLRTEDEVRRIPFLRGLAQKAGLIKTRNNKISQTGTVKAFLKEEPYNQLKQLLTVWLTKDHWGRPFGDPGLVEPIMDKLYSITYHLSQMKVGERVEYEVFEKDLFDEMQLIFSSGDPERDKYYSYWAVADAILEPLEQFGVVSLEKIPKKFLGEKVSAVKLTELGKSFLVG